ncbi:cyclophilin-like fold protein [Rathayibacter sp. VKM Ac-2857]|uniref:cyclophilin-like fold protein n=1 Tax=Rathayibacter sp. VKM Ac-2857 TaxID=2739020 RepID=UPI0015670F6A|nr:cyclophilin-like fold protein [Rathayibacter sp. VKM Ac-2857]NQX17993.1 hypothetical protein [Rathayibacter sp. VKM Ac-2857]
MRKLTAIISAALLTATLAACSSGSTEDPAESASPTATSTSTPTQTATETATPTETPAAVPAGETAITLTSGDQVVTATLNDSQVSQDLIAMLPQELSWFRNAGIEYITELDAPLTETGPYYTDVQPGDIVYYNPADSFTIIYEETSSVPTLTYMGEITSDLSVFRSLPDDVTFTVELAQ